MNATVIVALIAAISAIIAPTITAIVNNIHQSRMRKIELYEEKRISAINDYVALVSRFLQNTTYDNASDMGNAMNAIFLYAPQHTWDDIKELNHLVDTDNFAEAKAKLADVAMLLSPCVMKRHNRRKKNKNNKNV